MCTVVLLTQLYTASYVGILQANCPCLAPTCPTESTSTLRRCSSTLVLKSRWKPNQDSLLIWNELHCLFTYLLLLLLLLLHIILLLLLFLLWLLLSLLLLLTTSPTLFILITHPHLFFIIRCWTVWALWSFVSLGLSLAEFLAVYCHSTIFTEQWRHWSISCLLLFTLIIEVLRSECLMSEVKTEIPSWWWWS